MIDSPDRQQVVGLLVHGSATRSDFTPTSDIDMLVVLEADEAPPREYVDGGLFSYDYLFHTRKELESPAFVLCDPYLGTVLKHGVIVCDPLGLLCDAKTLAEEEHDLPEYSQQRVHARLKEMNECLKRMRHACENQDRNGFYLQYYLFGYRLLSIPMIAHSIAYSLKRSFGQIQALLRDSSHSSLVGLIGSALSVDPMPQAPFAQILSDLESVLASADRESSLQHSFVLAIRDGLAGVGQVLSEGLTQDSLWHCFVVVSAVARNAKDVPASAQIRLQQLMTQVCRLMRIESWDDIERTIALSKECVFEMETYCRELLEG